jgi:hypothetical protein
VDFNVGDPVVPSPIRTTIPVLLGDEPIEVLAYPKVMVVAEKLVTALQRGPASTRWRDFADLFMLVPGDLVESEIIEALRAVAGHRGVPLRPLGEVVDGRFWTRSMSGRKHGSWRRQRLEKWRIARSAPAYPSNRTPISVPVLLRWKRISRSVAQRSLLSLVNASGTTCA